MDNDELIDALTFGNLQTVVRELQKDPSIINKKDKIGWTPLMVAASSMQYDLCKELIQTFKANVKLASEVDGNNVLHVLGDTRGLQKEQETKYISTWELILKHGGSLKSQNFEGETPIHLACLRNNISIIKFLLGKNALSEEIINKTNKTGSTAIHYASAYGRTEIVKLLINYGANINIKGEHGTSEDLAQKFKHKETADLLKRMRELNSYLLLVPQEIQVFIFQFLTPEDLCNVSKTCVQLNKTSSHDSIWKPFGNPKWAEEAKTIGWKGMYLRFLRTQISAYLNRENSKSTNKNNSNTKSNNSSNNNEPIKEYKKITQGRIDLNPPSRPTTPDKPNYDYLLKFLLVGDSGVGKTSLLLRFSDDTFTTSYLSTIGVDFKIRTIMIDDAYVKLQIWDTAGPERFRTITSAYYRGAHGILLVYDMTDKLSFDHVKHWLTEIEKYALPSTEIALVGTKKDITDKRVVTTEDAMQYLATLEKRIPIFVETSAKTGENISEVFSNLALAITSKLSSSPMLYLGGYCKMGWPNYVPSTQAIQRMVRQLPVDKENSNESNTQTTKSSCEIQ